MKDRSQNMVWRPFYFANLIVDPKDENRIYKPDGPLIMSTDGGTSFNNISGGTHGDHHDVWIDPANTDHVITGDDGDDVGGQGLDALLDPREGRVHAQDQVAVLGRGPDQELGRMRAGEGADQHQPSSAAITPVTCRGTRAGASPAWPAGPRRHRRSGGPGAPARRCPGGRPGRGARPRGGDRP